MQQDNAPWGLARLSSEGKLSENGPYTYSYNSTGKDVTVYVLDSGLKSNPPEFGTRTELIQDTRDTYFESNGHGTHVAGIIGSKSYGVAKECNIRMYKDSIHDANGEIIDDVCKTFERILGHRKEMIKEDENTMTAILNISSRFDDRTDAKEIAKVIEEIVNEGRMLVVLCAGNQAVDNSNYPGVDIDGILVVAASDINDQFWLETEHRTERVGNKVKLLPLDGSNYGKYVNIIAPGKDIISLAYNPEANVSDENYYTETITLSGTSQAAPHVSGLAACILSQNKGLSAIELKEKILDMAKVELLNNKHPEDTKSYKLATLL